MSVSDSPRWGRDLDGRDRARAAVERSRSGSSPPRPGNRARPRSPGPGGTGHTAPAIRIAAAWAQRPPGPRPIASRRAGRANGRTAGSAAATVALRPDGVEAPRTRLLGAGGVPESVQLIGLRRPGRAARASGQVLGQGRSVEAAAGGGPLSHHLVASHRGPPLASGHIRGHSYRMTLQILPSTTIRINRSLRRLPGTTATSAGRNGGGS